MEERGHKEKKHQKEPGTFYHSSFDSNPSNLISKGHTALSSSALPGLSLGASIYGSFPPGSQNPHHREILMTPLPFHPALAFWQAQQEDLIFIDKMYPEFWPNAFLTMSMLSELRVWKQERLQTATHGNQSWVLKVTLCHREQFEIHLALERMQNNKNYFLLVFPQKCIKIKGLNRGFSFSYMESPHLHVIPHFPDKTE